MADEPSDIQDPHSYESPVFVARVNAAAVLDATRDDLGTRMFGAPVDEGVGRGIFQQIYDAVRVGIHLDDRRSDEVELAKVGRIGI